MIALILSLVGYLVVRLSHAAAYDGWQRLRIVQVAQGELGQTEFSPRVLQYTEGNRESWCADFVSWVYATAGYPFVTTASGGRSFWRISVVWQKYAGVPNLRDYFQSQGAWQAGGPGSSYNPGPGDVIIFGDTTEHTGIVEKVDYPANKDPVITTIEGNTGGGNPSAPGYAEAGDHVMRKTYGKFDGRISGYGTIINAPPSGAKYSF